MYTHFYGFSEEPFRDTPDPRFLFVVPGHERALSRLLKGIEERNGWILLLGEPGSGKTALIRHLLQALPEKPGIKTAFIFHPGISFEDLLKEILCELSVSPAPPEGTPLREHFIRSLSALASSGGTLVLFLDEAQELGLQVLEDLQAFFAKEIPFPECIQVVFSGQPPLEGRLQSQSLRGLCQRIRYRCSIAPLTAQESRRYLEHRLLLAGGKLDLFTPDGLDLVIRSGEGIPRTLNIICDNALRIGHRLSEPRIGGAIVRRALNEIYARPRRSFFSLKNIGGKSVLARLLIFLVAVFILACLYLLVAEKPLRHGAPGAARSEPPAPAAPVAAKEEAPSPKTEEPPPLAVEKAASAPDSKAAVLPDTPAQPKIGPRVKKSVSVVKGTTLHSLCREHYGFANITLMDLIMSLNPQITNPNLIRVNQVVKLPELKEENLVQEKPGGKTRIFLGTFANRELLESFREDPLLKGREIEVTRRRIETGETWHRFTAGVFADTEEALRTIRALKEKGLLPSFGGAPPKIGKGA